MITLAQHVEQIRQLILEHPETSNLPLVVHGIGSSFEIHHRAQMVTLAHKEMDRAQSDR